MIINRNPYSLMNMNKNKNQSAETNNNISFSSKLPEDILQKTIDSVPLPFLMQIENKINSDPRWSYLALNNQDKAFINFLKNTEVGNSVSLEELYKDKKLKPIKLRQLMIRLINNDLIILKNNNDNTDTLISVTDEFIKIVKSSKSAPGRKKGSVSTKIPAIPLKKPQEKVVTPEAKSSEKTQENIFANSTKPTENINPTNINKQPKTVIEKITRYINKQPNGSYSELNMAEKAFINNLLGLEIDKPIGIETICHKEKICKTDVKDLVTKLTNSGLIQQKPNSKNTSILIIPTRKLHNIPEPDSINKTEIKSGVLIFDNELFKSKMTPNEYRIVSTLINKKIAEGKVKKIETDTNIIIQFDKDNPGEISSFLEQFGRYKIPAVLIGSKKSISGGLELKGITGIFVDFAENISTKNLSHSFVSEKGFTKFEQQIIKSLFDNDQMSPTQLLDLLGLKPTNKFNEAVKNLLELKIIENVKTKIKNTKFVYKLNDDYKNIINKNLTTEEDINQLKQLINLTNKN